MDEFVSSDEFRYVSVTIHEFKNNISRYLRDLEHGRLSAVKIKRYDREIAFCFAKNRDGDAES